MTVTPVNNSVSAMNTTVNNMYNPYGNLFNPPDYFDTMFPMQTATAQEPVQTAPVENYDLGDSYSKEEDIYAQADDVASALLQNYKLAKEIESSYTENPTEAAVQQTETTNQTPVTQQTNTNSHAPALDTINTANGAYSMQDMMVATQIANQFANEIPMLPKTTDDIFATQIDASYGLNNINPNGNLNYAA